MKGAKGLAVFHQEAVPVAHLLALQLCLRQDVPSRSGLRSFVDKDYIMRLRIKYGSKGVFLEIYPVLEIKISLQRITSRKAGLSFEVLPWL